MRAGVGKGCGAGDGECFVSVGSCLMVGSGLAGSLRGSDLALGSDIVGYGTGGSIESTRGGTAAKTDGVVDIVVSIAIAIAVAVAVFVCPSPGAVHPAILRFIPRTSSASCGGAAGKEGGRA